MNDKTDRAKACINDDKTAVLEVEWSRYTVKYCKDCVLRKTGAKTIKAAAEVLRKNPKVKSVKELG